MSFSFIYSKNIFASLPYRFFGDRLYIIGGRDFVDEEHIPFFAIFHSILPYLLLLHIYFEVNISIIFKGLFGVAFRLLKIFLY
jgi:hypothetical protein